MSVGDLALANEASRNLREACDVLVLMERSLLLEGSSSNSFCLRWEGSAVIFHYAIKTVTFLISEQIPVGVSPVNFLTWLLAMRFGSHDFFLCDARAQKIYLLYWSLIKFPVRLTDLKNIFYTTT